MISVYLEDAERDYAVSAAYRDKPASVDQAEQFLETTRAAARLIRKVGGLPDDARIPVEVCLEILDNSGGGEDALLAAIQADGGAGVDRWTAARLRAALETLSGAGADLAALTDGIRGSLNDAIPRRQDAIVETRAVTAPFRRKTPSTTSPATRRISPASSIAPATSWRSSKRAEWAILRTSPGSRCTGCLVDRKMRNKFSFEANFPHIPWQNVLVAAKLQSDSLRADARSRDVGRCLLQTAPCPCHTLITRLMPTSAIPSSGVPFEEAQHDHPDTP